MGSNNLTVFSRWFEHSSVRNSPRRVIDGIPVEHFFSPSLAPVLNHPVFSSLLPHELKSVEVQLLYRYLRFTEYLETQQVNAVLLAISNGDYEVELSAELRSTAYKIYCDEAYHALQAEDMISQVEEASRISPLELPIELKSRLPLLELEFPETIRPLFQLFFVSVSENLVSLELRHCAKDKLLHPAIANLMKDHARDEALHAIFFGEVLCQVYQAVGPEKFSAFECFIPRFLKAYLVPERENMICLLSQGLSHELALNVVNEYLSESNTESLISNCSFDLVRTIQKIKKG